MEEGKAAQWAKLCNEYEELINKVYRFLDKEAHLEDIEVIRNFVFEGRVNLAVLRDKSEKLRQKL